MEAAYWSYGFCVEQCFRSRVATLVDVDGDVFCVVAAFIDDDFSQLGSIDHAAGIHYTPSPGARRAAADVCCNCSVVIAKQAAEYVAFCILQLEAGSSGICGRPRDFSRIGGHIACYHVCGSVEAYICGEGNFIAPVALLLALDGTNLSGVFCLGSEAFDCEGIAIG